MFEDLLKAFAFVGRFSWVNVTAGEESGGPLLARVSEMIRAVLGSLQPLTQDATAEAPTSDRCLPLRPLGPLSTGSPMAARRAENRFPSSDVDPLRGKCYILSRKGLLTGWEGLSVYDPAL